MKRFGRVFMTIGTKQTYLALMAAVALCSPSIPLIAVERSGDQSIGVMLGNPSGASYKMWVTNDLAIDAAAGVNQGEFDVHATLLWHHFTWSKNLKDKFIRSLADKGDLPLYFGIGPRLLFEHHEEFGIRLPAGVVYMPTGSKWEYFAEIAPVIRLTPDTGTDFDFAVGVRFGFPAIRPRSHD